MPLYALTTAERTAFCRRKKVLIPHGGKKAPARGAFGTPSENRTHNCPLGGGRYIHLTMEANYWIIYQTEQKGCRSRTFKCESKGVYLTYMTAARIMRKGCEMRPYSRFDRNCSLGGGGLSV